MELSVVGAYIDVSTIKCKMFAMQINNELVFAALRRIIEIYYNYKYHN